MSTRLSRDLGLFGLVSLSIGAMIGGGIFVLPGLATAMMGPSIWLAYLLAGLLVVAPALSKIELATALPGAGGTYLFIERGVGPMAGTVAGFGVWLVLVCKGSFALVGVSYYLRHFARVPVAPVALGLLAFLVVLNCLGAKKTARLQLAIVTVCLATLAVLVAWSLGNGEAPEAPALPMGLDGLLAATGFVFISYAGVTSVASVSEEVREPARDLPLAILISLGLMIVLYSTVALALVAAVDWRSLGDDPSPMATLALALGGDRARIAISVVAGLALVSMANSGILAASRYPMAMARDGLVPSVLERSSPRLGTPLASIVSTGGVMAAILLLVDVVRIAKLASTFQILVFSAECACVILFRESKAPWYRPTFRSPLYPWLPAFGCVSGIALIVYLGPVAIGSTLGVVVLGLGWYALYGRRRAQRSGLLQQMARRADLMPASGLATRADRPLLADGDLPGAEIVVPLLGREISPEALVETAASLAREGESMEVLRLKEVPPQTVLSSALEEADLGFRALERRIRIASERLPLEVRFDTVVTRDVRHTLHDYASRVHSRWVVMEWVAAEWRGAFVSNPFSWLLAHLPCNLALFHDAGNRYVRRIAVVAEPGPHDGLVLSTADRLAAAHSAELVFLRAFRHDVPEWRVEAAADYHDQLGQLCRAENSSRILRGADPVRALIEELVEYDLLVTGAPHERTLQSLFRRDPADRLFEDAPCSVLRLKTPRKETHGELRETLAAEGPPDLESHLDPATLVAGLEVKDKEALFRAIATAFADAHPEMGDSPLVERAFWKREGMQNTGIGAGLAIPHATLPTADRTRLGVFALARPVDYGLPGAQGVDLCFATVGPPSDRNTHLRLLAALSRRILQTDLPARLRAAPDPAALATALRGDGAG